MIATIIVARRLKPRHVSCHYVALLPLCWVVSRLSGGTLEYLPHELETQRTGLSGLKKIVETWIERRFVHSARNVVVVCDPIKEWYEKAYGLTNVHVVRNVPEKDAVQIRTIPEGGFRERFSIPDGARVFIYQGLISAGRGIEILLETFAALDPARYHLVLMGYGDDHYRAKLDDAARQHANIHYQSAVAREWIVSYSASADIGILIPESNSLSYKYSLPNKFFEWAHAGLPIVLSENMEYQAQILTDNGFGWVTSHDNLMHVIEGMTPDIIARYAEQAKKFAQSAVWENDAAIFAHVYSR
jgi:glycosyltransferase involved in cell wall biosynthesis